MVGQHLDHLTFIDAAMATALDHQFKFRLQCRQAEYSLLHLGKPRLGDGIGGAAGLMRIVLEGEQSPDGADLEAEFSSAADEGQARRSAAA